MSTEDPGPEETGIPMPTNGGYQKLAAAMGSVPSLLVYKRFARLNAKRILHMQAELLLLQAKLDVIVEEDRTSGDPVRRDLGTSWASLRGSSRDTRLNLQWETMEQINDKLKEYNDALLQQSRIQALPKPHNLDVQFIQEWLKLPTGGDFFLHGTTEHAWDDNEDLVCLKPPEPGEEKNSSARWLSETILPWFHSHIGHRVLKPLRTDDGTTMWNYDDKIFTYTANAISAVLTSLLPTALIFVLVSLKSRTARLAVIMASTVLFSLTLLFFGKARRSEIFIGAIAPGLSIYKFRLHDQLHIPPAPENMAATKVICIVGITGKQGGSVAQRFLKDPTYNIRGLTRNPSSAAAQTLAAQGVEIIQADLDDTPSLQSAFAGANIIFSVTDYWEPFFRPDCREKAAEKGVSCRRYAYDVEFQQGKNIADAAAQTVDTLEENGLIASTLSHAGECSGGNFKELYHFDAKADVFPNYVQQNYPELARKMSCVQTGYFTSSYKLVPDAYLAKAPEGGFEMTFPTAPTAPVPHLDVVTDLGNFIYAVSKMPPGKSYMAAGTNCSWSEYMRIWGGVTSMPARYRQITMEELVDKLPDKDFSLEFGDMLAYSTDPGYDGGDKKLLTAEDIRNAGIDCPMTTLEEWMKNEDWSSVLTR
ncbi:hypothetical protein FQN54_000593 [Arachnomyces sp. PD_36]|nr:hypothetical protein FQN54_000593 [Arachnomyces sp. PD_36]